MTRTANEGSDEQGRKGERTKRSKDAEKSMPEILR